MAYGLPSPTPYHYPTWNLEMSPMPPAPHPTPDSNTLLSTSFPHSRSRLWLQYYKKWLAITNPRSRTIHYHLLKKNKKNVLLNTPTRIAVTGTHARPGPGLFMRWQSLKPKFSTWLECSFPWRNLGPRPRNFFFRVFFLDKKISDNAPTNKICRHAPLAWP